MKCLTFGILYMNALKSVMGLDSFGLCHQGSMIVHTRTGCTQLIGKNFIRAAMVSSCWRTSRLNGTPFLRQIMYSSTPEPGSLTKAAFAQDNCQMPSS